MIGTFVLVLGVFATATWHESATGQEKNRKGKITVGKETTYVTGPLDKEGYVDYVAALNERLRKGVTPKNNANILIWKAIGPHPQGETMPAEFFRWMGAEAPPERGDYFMNLIRYLKDQNKTGAAKGAERIDAELEYVRQRPWTEKAYPHLDAWLKANAKPLALTVEASKRSHYYSPWVPARTEKGPSGLLGGPVPGVLRCSELANALAARAMLRVGQGKYDDAWQDLLACHRLGRLVARGSTLIEFLAGAAIESIASATDLAFLECAKPDAKRIDDCLRALHKLPPFPTVADKLDLGERFAFLELLTMIERHGARYLDTLAGDGAKDVNPFGALMLQNIDWDPALRDANKRFDRLVAATREPDHAARKKQLEQFDIEIKLLKNKVADWGGVTLFLGGKQARGKLFGDTMMCLLVPALLKVQQAGDRARQIQDNLSLAFALEGYRRDRGRYPTTLDALAPKYLKQIPRDVFTGGALVYRPSAKGYLLYSVGANGRDDGGRGYDDEPPGDDLSVRMPLPELRRP